VREKPQKEREREIFPRTSLFLPSSLEKKRKKNVSRRKQGLAAKRRERERERERERKKKREERKREHECKYRASKNVFLNTSVYCFATN